VSGKSYAPLGTVLHILGKEVIVKLKSRKIPRKDMIVYNENMEKIGVTTNPFGPVKSPYVGIVLNSNAKIPEPGSMLLLKIKKKKSGLITKKHYSKLYSTNKSKLYKRKKQGYKKN